MAIVEVTIVPVGTGTTTVSGYEAECLKIVKKSGLRHLLTPMGTALEGDLDEVLQVIREMQETIFAAGVQRISTIIKIDDRRDGKVGTLAGKIQSVEDKLRG